MTCIVEADFTQDPEIYERIADTIRGLEVGVLVNNVGMSYKYPEYLDQVNILKGQSRFFFKRCPLSSKFIYLYNSYNRTCADPRLPNEKHIWILFFFSSFSPPVPLADE